jgi:recombination protein RecA
MYGKGISKEGDLLDVGVDFGIVDKSGSWFSYNEQRLGQGRDNSKEFLIANPDVADAIEAEIRAKNAASKMTAEPEAVEADLLEDEEIE